MEVKRESLISDWNLLKQFWPYVTPYRAYLFIGLLLVPITGIIGVIPPVLMMHGVDVNLRGETGNEVLRKVLEAVGLEQALKVGVEGITTIGVLYLLVVILEYGVRTSQLYLLQWVGHQSVGQLRVAVFRHILSQAPRFFDRNPPGALLTRTTSDLEALFESLSLGAVLILADLMGIAAIGTMMVLLSPTLTLVLVVAAPVLVLVVNFFRKRLKKMFVAVRKSLSELNAYFQESLAGSSVIRSFDQEVPTYEEFRRLSRKNLRDAQWSNAYDASLYAVMEGMAALCVAAVLWYGGVRVLGGALSLGLLVAFVEYVNRIFVPIKEFSGRFAILQQAVAALERVMALQRDVQRITPGTLHLPPFRGEVRLERVSFRYALETEPVLRDVSIAIRSRQVVAVVGATGSGKTTLSRLLTRMYDGYEGSITLDGKELRDLTVESVRRQIGVVHQEVRLFAGSIADNISLGNPNISRTQIEQASRLVHADVFIRALPGAYDFQVTDNGGNLSAGQAQLIAFARVMAADPPFVILDEATASVDSETETRIQQAIGALLSARTVLVIAHRLSTIQASDQIIVMKRGQIVEQGTHESLLELDGHYASLCRAGFKDG